MPDAQFEEVRALAIAPLAFGADTGRRMAPTDAVEPLTECPERPIIDLRATLGRGDGFARVLERAGVGRAEADRIATMIGEVLPIGDIRPGTVDGPDAWPAAEPDGGAAARQARASAPASTCGSSWRASNGALALTAIPIAVDETPLRIQGRVGASLYRSARAAGVPARVGRSLYPRADQPDQRARRAQFRATGSTSSSSIAAPRPARSRSGNCSMPA